MKKLTLLVVAAAIFAAACTNEKKAEGIDSLGSDSSQKDTTAIATVDSATMMKAWEDYMKPGEAHALMAKWVGKWNVTLNFFEDGQPVTSKAVAEYKMKLGGRYLQCNYKGEVQGMPFEGENTMAFDNSRKLYLSTWIDNMGTGMMYTEGTYDPATKTITSKGKMVDVPTGKQFETRETHSIIDNDNQKMEMFDIKNGKETKSMEIMMTRIK